MTEKVKQRLTKKVVDALLPNSEVWDAEVRGFGARRQLSAVRSFTVKYRLPDGRERRHTIGKHGPDLTVETARKVALETLRRVRNGEDPAAEKRELRQSPTVADLCDRYLADVEDGRLLTRGGAAKKVSTVATDRSRINGHIRPLLGHLKVTSVTARDVEQFMHAVAGGKTAKREKTEKKRGLSNVRGGKGAATRTVGLLGALFTYAQKQGLRSDNPVQGITRFRDGQRQRRLSDAEYVALGEAFAKATAAGVPPAAIGAARFLLLTGWRKGEALALRREDVDLARQTARLPDTKSGASVRPLSKAACDVLASMPTTTSSLFFPPTRGTGLMSGFSSMWERICKLGGVPADVTPHVLRHSFASLAADTGRSDTTIGAIIGHKGHSITSRYIHAADAVLIEAANCIAGEILRRMEGATTK
ncbi:tyrosine-type recombinase/integrase [Roseomonas sp. CCTCC AB2023176]|uniref:tyrosine-type recombinase/integrase n=1 Tax=Roseomonas sp. CCTCC AB2023176 TaxID=3342640 RepID=UPI0035DBEAF0